MVTKVDGIPASGALPPLPTGLSLADPDEKAKYNESIQKVLEAFENRSQIPWFKMAAAFADPGRTGTFGESFGKAMGTIGQAQEEDRARALPIAQMRAQLAGQQLQMSKEEQAFKLAASQLGFGSPQQLQQSLMSGEGTFGIGNRFSPDLYFMISKLDPKLAETIKNAAGMDTERMKAMIEATKMNMSIAQMYDTFGKKVTDKFMQLQGGRFPGQSAPPAGQSSAPTTRPQTMSTPAGEVPTGADGVPTTAIRDSNGNVVDIAVTEEPKSDTVNIQGVQVTRPAQGASTAPATGSPQFGYKEIAPNKFQLLYSGRVVPIPSDASDAEARDIIKMALQAEQDIYKKTIEVEAKPFEEKTAQLLQFDNQATAVNLNRVDKIQTLAQKYSTLPGVLQQTDTLSGFGKWIAAVGAAAQEGIQAGKFGAFSIPIEKFVNTATLSQKQKEILGELAREISNEFLAGMRANRGLLGVNPTDNDARLFQAAAESPTSLARNIFSWSQGRAAEYESMNDIYKGYTQFRTQRGRGFDPASFFIDENSPYHTGVKNYTERLLRVKENSPGMR
jgi:hypothetical protein